MKSSYFLIIFLLASCVYNAQNVQDSIPKSYELAGPEYAEWQALYDNWRITEYPKILKENKLKMNCNGCESIYMDVIFYIDAVGKLNNYKVISSKKCAATFSKKLEKRFLKLFLESKFPSKLRNTRFEVRLGTGLKC
jgi:hypothetical protein